MKLYKIRGTSEWVPWSVLYNERGYNSVPCIDMAFKSISPWGTSAGTGYRTNGSGDVTYFVSGKTGWYLAYSLPGALGVYPDEATPIQMIKDGVVSDAVWMEFFGSKWYLIQAEIVNERYWIHELALPEYGWEIYEGKDYEFILVDGTTGRIVHGVEQLNEMVFAPTGYFTIEDTGDIVFVEQSPYPIVSRFHVDFDTVQTLADGAYIDTILPYYTSKLYIAGIVDRVAETVVDFGLTVSNEGGCVRVTNNTGASVTLTRLAIQSMDATGAEVVEVVDGQDNHAYAFKWNDGGTPYWWISYSGERHWTDALGNWSEVPPVVLPTVSGYMWIANPDTYIPSDESAQGYDTNNNPVAYDPGCVYGVIAWYKYDPFNEFGGRNEIDLIGANGYLYVKNVSSSTIHFFQAKYAICSDSTATVITVYDSSNNAYNAFKFTASGTDYYYVLDGTQTDWTDDLSSIGYHLPDIDIDTNFGDAVSIPSGYTVQSVKASRAYAVCVIDYDEWNYFFDMHVQGQDVYCSDTNTNLLGISVDPCIGMFQITTINSQGSYNGYHLSCRSSQTTAIAPSAIENKELNQNGNFISARLSNTANPGALQVCHAAIVSGKPMIIRKYDSSGNLVGYYMNVPQSLWQFQNGVFSWLGDSTSQSDMAYYYKGTGTTAVRIHCVSV